MNYKIAIIGLGYVGLPLSLQFSKKYKVIGLDINSNRINQLKLFNDFTNEVDEDQLKKGLKRNLKLTSNYNDIIDCNIFIITVPTPITETKKPDLTYLISASKSIGKILKKGNIVIYESTVYPGCTEEDCVPLLETYSKLKYNEDFFCGYSPERINPGDKVNSINTIVKVTSGSNNSTAKIVDRLYSSIIDAGTHPVSSIKIAEASKAIENAQRDLNISFVNELAIIFDKMDIDTTEVLNAAGTKWNFLNFKPGLVGGHCIGVDPYYLAFKSQSLGYNPEVILSGRKVNDNMGNFVATRFIRLMKANSIKVLKSKVLLLGITYKENCPDIRNSKIPSVSRLLEENGINVDVYDPHASNSEVFDIYGIKLIENLSIYDGIILAVSHNEFKGLDFKNLKKNNESVIFDIKSFLSKDMVDLRL